MFTLFNTRNELNNIIKITKNTLFNNCFTHAFNLFLFLFK